MATPGSFDITTTSDFDRIRGEFIADGRTVKQAAASALNRAATTVRKEAKQHIRKNFPLLRPSFLQNAIHIFTANPDYLKATLHASGKRIELREFMVNKGGKRVSKKARGKLAGKRAPIRVFVRRSYGVQLLKGKPTLKGLPFVQRMASGHVGIFQRTGRWALNTDNTEITELYSIDVPGAFGQRQIFEAISITAQRRFAELFFRELKWRTEGKPDVKPKG